MTKKSSRIDIRQEYDEGVPAQSILSDEEIKLLPSWCGENIHTAKLIGRTKQTIEIEDGRRYHLKNKLNHLSGSEWTFFTNSVINTNYSTTGEDSYEFKLRKIHPTPKPPQLIRDIIRFFSK